ncbi:MAG: RecQ family ATP-dependent DNA helicase [Chitinophagales bacterium]|nr:RecQ family ATP-dependent DNA helicase [Chitinophagales bacterium]MBP9703971.1 RecQ family ATP-dependent DNA helicase [Chitinophagales bacterium]
MEKAIDILKKYWGYNEFRPQQQEIIETVAAGKDSLALLPTGGGKSICYQIPALMHPGICIVISPLIALMKDQVEQLNALKIPAVAVYSGLTKKQVDIELDNAAYGKYKLLYISPERLISPLFKERLKKMQVNLLAVDEAHCISQWGYDFRPPYLQIALVHEIIPDTPIIALTATATTQVMNDISEKLQLKNPTIFKSSFERDNIHFVVREEEDKFHKLIETLRSVKGSGIVYVRNRRKTKEIAEYLNRNHIPADFYHAGLEITERAKKQDNWIRNKKRIMVCTNAFGMGINKPDVRIVIHWDIPESIEAYYQEAGRAGRDGIISFAGLIYNKHDIDELARIQSEQHLEPDVIKKIYHQMGSYLKLAYGAGVGESFDFDITEFSNAVKIPAKHVYRAIQILQQNGYLYFNEPMDRISTIHFTVDHETLYRFQVENKLKEPVIKMLLRMCPGILDGYVPVRESEIAFQLSYSRHDFINELIYLQQNKILEYNPVSGKSQLTFIVERLHEENINLDTALLNTLRIKSEKRLEAMSQYTLNKTECRVKEILAYFDERYSRCNRCDICMEKNKLGLADVEFNKVYSWLQKQLNKKSLSPEQIYEMSLPIRKEKFIEALLFMTDNKIIIHKPDNLLEWRG